MIPEFTDDGYLPRGVHRATLEEIAARFGQEPELRQVQMESLRWLMDLARRADVLKLNDGEVGRLASWIRTGEALHDTPHDDEAIARACETLAKATNVSRICVTRGEEGAAFWDGGSLTTARAPHIEVKDTVGAGDAFIAGLMVGLTRGIDHQRVLEIACRLGAYVASHYGATPLLPPELTQPLR